MVSGKRQMSYRALLLLAAVSARRMHVSGAPTWGPEIIQDPYDVLVKRRFPPRPTCCACFGPAGEHAEDNSTATCFVYAYRRENFSELTLREPIVHAHAPSSPTPRTQGQGRPAGHPLRQGRRGPRIRHRPRHRRAEGVLRGSTGNQSPRVVNMWPYSLTNRSRATSAPLDTAPPLG